MKRDDRTFDREVEEIVERGRRVRPLPDVVRARALARARATVAAAESSTPAVMPPAVARRRVGRMAAAAALTLLLGAAGAVAALRAGALDRFRSAPASPSSPPAVTPERIAPVPSEPPPSAAPEPPAAVKRRPGRTASAQESYAAELRLLHRAQVAYAGEDLSAALMLVAEHARRYPSGRLAEEREALRIRSLAAAGRREDARRATATFAARFPRSVLLPRLQQTASP